MTKAILLTGATGAIGAAVVTSLVGSGVEIRAIVRQPEKSGAQEGVEFIVHPLDQAPVPAEVLDGVGVVLHLAGETRPSDLKCTVAQSKNVALARHLGASLDAASIPRAIFMSSVAATVAEVRPAMARRYGLEKLAAEQAFADGCAGKTQIAILRPPAIYGAGCGGNLATLSKLVGRGLPLPLGLAKTNRPYLSLPNLVDLLCHLLVDEAPWQVLSGMTTLTPRDPTHRSAREIVRMMADQLDRPPRLVPIPETVLRGLASLAGKTELLDGVFGEVPLNPDHEVDARLGWTPGQEMPDSLAFLSRT